MSTTFALKNFCRSVSFGVFLIISTRDPEFSLIWR